MEGGRKRATVCVWEGEGVTYDLELELQDKVMSNHSDDERALDMLSREVTRLTCIVSDAGLDHLQHSCNLEMSSSLQSPCGESSGSSLLKPSRTSPRHTRAELNGPRTFKENAPGVMIPASTLEMPVEASRSHSSEMSSLQSKLILLESDYLALLLVSEMQGANKDV